jgi:vancomycin resistance protein YoaR
VGRSQTSIEGRSEDQRHNVALSLRAIQGKVIPPDGVFSFNQAVGSWSRDKGFRRAPVSFNGSLIDAWGGGVCQTSTTLYNAALLGGLEIVERHSHRFCPSYVPPGLDAAVAFPNIDLRIRNPYNKPLVIRGKMEAGRLEVSLTGPVDAPDVVVSNQILKTSQPATKTLGTGGSPWVRSPGKPGAEVEVIRSVKGVRERISRDTYPVMHRVVEWVEDVK